MSIQQHSFIAVTPQNSHHKTPTLHQPPVYIHPPATEYEQQLPSPARHKRGFKHKLKHALIMLAHFPGHLINNHPHQTAEVIPTNPLMMGPTPQNDTFISMPEPYKINEIKQQEPDPIRPPYQNHEIDIEHNPQPVFFVPAYRSPLPPLVIPEDRHEDFAEKQEPNFYDTIPPNIEIVPKQLSPIFYEPSIQQHNFQSQPHPAFDFHHLVPPQHYPIPPNYDIEANLHPMAFQPVMGVPPILQAKNNLGETATSMLGINPKSATFKQGSIGDCYLLAGLDAVLHHRDAEQLLDKIRITIIPGNYTPAAYEVTFPTGRNTVIYAHEVGVIRDNKKPLEGPFALQLLELAYARVTRSERNRARGINAFENDGRCHTPTIVEEGLPEKALGDIFGGETVRVDAVDNPPSNTLFYGDEPLDMNLNAVNALKNLLQSASRDSKHTYLLSATTPQFGSYSGAITLYHQDGTFTTYDRRHSFSIRDFDPEAETVTIANPHDTAAKVQTLSLNDFCRVFRAVSGIKLPR